MRGSERYGPEGYLRAIAIREVPEAFIKSHQTLRRKPSDRDVNHNRGAVRTHAWHVSVGNFRGKIRIEQCTLGEIFSIHNVSLDSLRDTMC